MRLRKVERRNLSYRSRFAITTNANHIPLLSDSLLPTHVMWIDRSTKAAHTHTRARTHAKLSPLSPPSPLPLPACPHTARASLLSERRPARLALGLYVVHCTLPARTAQLGGSFSHTASPGGGGVNLQSPGATAYSKQPPRKVNAGITPRLIFSCSMSSLTRSSLRAGGDGR